MNGEVVRGGRMRAALGHRTRPFDTRQAARHFRPEHEAKTSPGRPGGWRPSARRRRGGSVTPHLVLENGGSGTADARRYPSGLRTICECGSMATRAGQRTVSNAAEAGCAPPSVPICAAPIGNPSTARRSCRTTSALTMRYRAGAWPIPTSPAAWRRSTHWTGPGNPHFGRASASRSEAGPCVTGTGLRVPAD